MENFKVDTIHIVKARKPLKQGWSAKEKLKELLAKQWGDFVEVQNGTSERLIIHFSGLVIIDYKVLQNIIDESEEYGKEKNENSEKSFKTMRKNEELLGKYLEDKSIKVVISWSMDIPRTDTMATVAFNGKVRFYDYDYHRDDDNGKDDKLSEPITNPTWMQVGEICNNLVSKRGYASDHIFLETIELMKKENYKTCKDIEEDIYLFHFGS